MKDKKICIIGRHGFLGGALNNRLLMFGAKIQSYPTPDTEIVFNFGSPVHPPFEESPEYYMQDMIDKHLFLLAYCQRYNIQYVWPSSALVYEPDKDIAFRRCKMAMEDLQFAYQLRVIGLRIFPVYGPGETRTAIYQWCKAAKEGKPLEIYGDGTQTRDFIYIDDAIDQILSLIVMEKVGIADVGAGKPTSFNDITKIITEKTQAQVKYLPAPYGYAKGIFSQEPLPTIVSLEEGITRVLARL